MKKIVTTIRKNDFEELRVAISEFEASGKVHQMMSARVFYLDGKEYKPGKNGINLKVELLPQLVEALAKAEKEARSAGLLPRAT